MKDITKIPYQSFGWHTIIDGNFEEMKEAIDTMEEIVETSSTDVSDAVASINTLKTQTEADLTSMKQETNTAVTDLISDTNAAVSTITDDIELKTDALITKATTDTNKLITETTSKTNKLITDTTTSIEEISRTALHESMIGVANGLVPLDEDIRIDEKYMPKDWSGGGGEVDPYKDYIKLEFNAEGLGDDEKLSNFLDYHVDQTLATGLDKKYLISIKGNFAFSDTQPFFHGIEGIVMEDGQYNPFKDMKSSYSIRLPQIQKSFASYYGSTEGDFVSPLMELDFTSATIVKYPKKGNINWRTYSDALFGNKYFPITEFFSMENYMYLDIKSKCDFIVRGLRFLSPTILDTAFFQSFFGELINSEITGITAIYADRIENCKIKQMGTFFYDMYGIWCNKMIKNQIDEENAGGIYQNIIRVTEEMTENTINIFATNFGNSYALVRNEGAMKNNKISANGAMLLEFVSGSSIYTSLSIMTRGSYTIRPIYTALLKYSAHNADKNAPPNEFGVSGYNSTTHWYAQGYSTVMSHPIKWNGYGSAIPKDRAFTGSHLHFKNTIFQRITLPDGNYYFDMTKGLILDNCTVYVENKNKISKGGTFINSQLYTYALEDSSLIDSSLLPIDINNCTVGGAAPDNRKYNHYISIINFPIRATDLSFLAEPEGINGLGGLISGENTNPIKGNYFNNLKTIVASKPTDTITTGIMLHQNLAGEMINCENIFLSIYSANNPFIMPLICTQCDFAKIDINIYLDGAPSGIIKDSPFVGRGVVIPEFYNVIRKRD